MTRLSWPLETRRGIRDMKDDTDKLPGRDIDERTGDGGTSSVRVEWSPLRQEGGLQVGDSKEGDRTCAGRLNSAGAVGNAMMLSSLLAAEDAHLRPFSENAFDPHVPAVSLDQVLDDCKAEAGSAHGS